MRHFYLRLWWADRGIRPPRTLYRPEKQRSHLTDDYRHAWSFLMNRLCVVGARRTRGHWDFPQRGKKGKSASLPCFDWGLWFSWQVTNVNSAQTHLHINTSCSVLLVKLQASRYSQLYKARCIISDTFLKPPNCMPSVVWLTVWRLSK